MFSGEGAPARAHDAGRFNRNAPNWSFSWAASCSLSLFIRHHAQPRCMATFEQTGVVGAKPDTGRNYPHFSITPASRNSISLLHWFLSQKYNKNNKLTHHLIYCVWRKIVCLKKKTLTISSLQINQCYPSHISHIHHCLAFMLIIKAHKWKGNTNICFYPILKVANFALVMNWLSETWNGINLCIRPLCLKPGYKDVHMVWSVTTSLCFCPKVTWRQMIASCVTTGVTVISGRNNKRTQHGTQGPEGKEIPSSVLRGNADLPPCEGLFQGLWQP